MRDLKKHEGLHPIHVDALKIIERHGWHVMSVCPRKDSDDKREWFSYSTGLLFSHNHPEIILCGLSSRTAHAIINEIGNAVASGRKYDLDKDFTVSGECTLAGIPNMSFSRDGFTKMTNFRCGNVSGRMKRDSILGTPRVIQK
jgi:Domain of unknown function (DUF4262)